MNRTNIFELAFVDPLMAGAVEMKQKRLQIMKKLTVILRYQPSFAYQDFVKLKIPFRAENFCTIQVLGD